MVIVVLLKKTMFLLLKNNKELKSSSLFDRDWKRRRKGQSYKLFMGAFLHAFWMIQLLLINSEKEFLDDSSFVIFELRNMSIRLKLM